MKFLIAILIFSTTTTICLSAYTSNNYYNQRDHSRTQNNLEWSDYTYDLNQGQCKGQKLVQEDIFKESDPFTVKKTTYTWMGRGLFHATCIKVINRMPRDEHAGEARITDGGVGQGIVKIDMISKNSQRLHFTVEIWGEENNPGRSNIAIMSNTPNQVLYMNGKKYCECH